MLQYTAVVVHCSTAAAGGATGCKPVLVSSIVYEVAVLSSISRISAHQQTGGARVDSGYSACAHVVITAGCSKACAAKTAATGLHSLLTGKLDCFICSIEQLLALGWWVCSNSRGLTTGFACPEKPCCVVQSARMCTFSGACSLQAALYNIAYMCILFQIVFCVVFCLPL
jgi:hypothetical protein